jgi:hypothetical protein
MKRLAIIAIVAVGLGFAATLLVPSVQTITLPEKIVEVAKVEVKSELDTRVEAARAEAADEIEAKAQAAYDAAKNQALKEIELKVISAYRKEVEAKETELSKQVGQY